MCLHLLNHTQGGGDVARVKQSCLTGDIWLRAECGNTIRDRSKVNLTNYDTGGTG